MPAQTTPQSALLEQTLDKFWETIPPLWGTIRAHIRAVATENFEISVEQFHILRFIRRGCQSVSGLADARNISRPAVSNGVDALVQKGLVARTPDQVDRRRISLSLTPEGNVLLDSVFQNTRDWMKSGMADLSPEELDAAVRGMEVLQRMIG